MSDYRVRGRAFLLTWSQVASGSLDELQLFIAERLQPENYIVCQEHHQDEGIHYHGFIEFKTSIDRKIERFFYEGVRPNIQAKTTGKARENAFYYCSKEGDFRCSEAWESGYPECEREPVQDRPTLAEGLAACESKFEFLEWCLQRDIPSGYAIPAWNCKFESSITILAGAGDDGTIVSAMLSAMEFDVATTRSLVLVGPSGCGKTTWAKRNVPKPAIRVTHIDDLKSLRPGYHRGIIFDDMSFCGDENGKGAWPRTSQIHLVDFYDGSSINVKHSIVHIPPKIHKIFIGNFYMFTEDEAIARRIKRVDLYSFGGWLGFSASLRADVAALLNCVGPAVPLPGPHPPGLFGFVKFEG